MEKRIEQTSEFGTVSVAYVRTPKNTDFENQLPPALVKYEDIVSGLTQDEIGALGDFRLLPEAKRRINEGYFRPRTVSYFDKEQVVTRIARARAILRALESAGW